MKSNEQVKEGLSKIPLKTSLEIICPHCGQTISATTSYSKEGTKDKDFRPIRVARVRRCIEGHEMSSGANVCKYGHPAARPRQELAAEDG